MIKFNARRNHKSNPTKDAGCVLLTAVQSPVSFHLRQQNFYEVPALPVAEHLAVEQIVGLDDDIVCPREMIAGDFVGTELVTPPTLDVEVRLAFAGLPLYDID